MRKALVLLIALPACAQGVDRFWYVDVHRFAPDLSGHFRGVSNGSPISVDFRNDLALSRDKSKPGASLEYQGPRFGLELSGDVQTYAGSNLVPANITIEGQTYRANTLVTSSVRATTWNFNGTVRYLTWPRFWLGADLGVRYTTLELQASGASGFSGATATARYRANLPIPQLGPSLGFSAAGGRLVGRGMVHLLTFKGATYNRLGIDLRYFPISWLGIRVFGDAERFRVPDGSIKSDLDITLDRTGTGFGIVARF